MQTRQPYVEVHYEEPEEIPRKAPSVPWYKDFFRYKDFENFMVRRILIIVVLIAIAVLAYWGWTHIKASLQPQGSAYLVPSDTPANVDGTGKVLIDKAELDRLRALANTNTQSAAPQAPQSSMVPPSQDTLVPIPPNGQVYAGSGRYQLYRQGDITWRMDTQTGTACVMFATNEEWRKPQVYRRGCNQR
ncbi:MAG: hypothetical protein ACYC46_03310 [Acidobacteriaceae bacterium]